MLSKEKAVYRVPTDKRIVALTFDVGWGTTSRLYFGSCAVKGLRRLRFFFPPPGSPNIPMSPEKYARSVMRSDRMVMRMCATPGTPTVGLKNR